MAAGSEGQALLNDIAQITGVDVESIDDAKRAADVLLSKGVGSAVITLGAQGALLHSANASVHVEAFDAGPVVETTGAGDAFNGGLAVGLASGMDPVEALRLGCAVAGISVTRPGTANSMPTREELLKLGFNLA